MFSQRVADLLAGKTPDRLPWVPELNEGFCHKVLGLGDKKHLPYIESADRVAKLIGADQLHRVLSVRTEHNRVTREQDPITKRVTYRTPKGELHHWQEPSPESGTTFTREHLVKGPQDFAAYQALVEDEHYVPQYEHAAAEIAVTGMPTIDVPATPLMHILMWVMDVQPTLMAMIDFEDQMAELMAAVHRKNLEYYRLAAKGPGLMLRPMEDTSSMLTGPSMYAKHCVGMLNDYARIAHEAGKLFVPHMCGHLDGMLDVLKEVDLDGIEAVTTPPLGDANLPRIREKLGDIWILGGIDPSRYAATSKDEMIAHAKLTLEQMRGDRKFMLGSEEIPLAARMENVQAVADLIKGTANGFYA